MEKTQDKTYFLAASLICADFMRLGEEIKSIQESKLDYIHFDVMDGLFVPRYGLFPELITQIRKTSNIPMDVHMMVNDAEDYLETFYAAGLRKENDIFVVHAESTKHLDRVVRKIKEKGIKAGVALNPATSLHVLDYILPQLDLVMLMAINPGIVGHKLIPSMIEKISHLKEKVSEYPNIIIEVDGGVNFESALKMVAAGASMLVCGTQTIFQPQTSLKSRVQDLRKILDS